MRARHDQPRLWPFLITCALISAIGSAQAATDYRFFKESHKETVQQFYGFWFKHADCPVGLIRYEGSCVSKNPQRQWQIGKALLPSVSYNNIHHVLKTKLGPPPAGHRYIRITDSLLLIHTQSGLVVDAVAISPGSLTPEQ